MHTSRKFRPATASPVIILSVLGMIGAGCTYTFSPGSPGTLTVRRPGTLPGAPAAPTAVSSAVGADLANVALPPSGTFVGVGRTISNRGALCENPLRINNFIVGGDTVTFGRFRGTIRPDGTLEMQAGGSFVYGRFNGTHFDGRFWAPPPTCTYQLSLNLHT